MMWFFNKLYLNKLLLFIFLFLSFVLLYLFHKIILWKSVDLFYLIIFFVILILYFCIYFSLKNNFFKTYFLIIFFSLFFSFYSYELFLTIKYKTYKISNKIKFLNKKNKNLNNIKFTLSIAPSEFIKNEKFIPLSGISDKKTIFCNEEGYYAIYDSDKFGFNNPNNVWGKTKINQNLILIGDSFTQGACVNRPNDIASVVRTINNNINVINLGYQGNGPLISLASLKEYLPINRFKSGAVFYLFFSGNDIENLQYELKSKILLQYLYNQNFSQRIKFKQKKVDETLEKYLLSRKDKDTIIIVAENFVKLFNLRNY